MGLALRWTFLTPFHPASMITASLHRPRYQITSVNLHSSSGVGCSSSVLPDEELRLREAKGAQLVLSRTEIQT